jgi:hypothetical protein
MLSLRDALADISQQHLAMSVGWLSEFVSQESRAFFPDQGCGLPILVSECRIISMKSFEAKVTGVVKLPTYRIKAKPGDRRNDIFLTLWRMGVSYLAKDEIYEIELREPLKQFVCTEYSTGTSGFAEFDLFASPPVNVGDRIQIDAYEPGERAREDGDR